MEVERGEVVVIIGCERLRQEHLPAVPQPGSKSPTGAGFFLEDVEITDPKTDLPKVRRNIGMIFQQFNLFPHMSAIRNVMEGPLTVLKMSGDQAREHAAQLLDKVGLSDKLERQARTALGRAAAEGRDRARALAMEPKVMLFDEVTSALDPELVGEVLSVMKQLADEGMTMVVVTHEMQFGERVADQVVMFDEGVILEQGPPDKIFQRAESERTRRFLNQLHWGRRITRTPVMLKQDPRTRRPCSSISIWWSATSRRWPRSSVATGGGMAAPHERAEGPRDRAHGARGGCARHHLREARRGRGDGRGGDPGHSHRQPGGGGGRRRSASPRCSTGPTSWSPSTASRTGRS